MATSQIIDSPDAMRAFGKQLAKSAGAGQVIALQGPMGAGKTCLAQGFAAGIGYEGEVTSPTYTLAHEYRGGRLPIYHLDCYRLETPEAVVSFSWHDYMPSTDGVTLIEWPERIEKLLQNVSMNGKLLWIHIQSLDESRRQIQMSAR